MPCLHKQCRCKCNGKESTTKKVYNNDLAECYFVYPEDNYFKHIFVSKHTSEIHRTMEKSHKICSVLQKFQGFQEQFNNLSDQMLKSFPILLYFVATLDLPCQCNFNGYTYDVKVKKKKKKKIYPKLLNDNYCLTWKKPGLLPYLELHHLRVMDTLSGEATLTKLFLFPSEEGSILKGKDLPAKEAAPSVKGSSLKEKNLLLREQILFF